MSDATAHEMSPEASPVVVSKKSGVRRVNNVPMLLVGAALTAFLVMMALVAADRAARKNQPAEGPRPQVASTETFAKEIVGEQTGGLVEPVRLPEMPGPPTPPRLDAPAPAGAVLVARPEDPDAPPKPPNRSAGLQGPERDDEAERIRMAKLQLLEEAVKARTGVQFAAPRSTGSAPASVTANGSAQTREEMLARIAEARQQIDAATRDDPTAAYQARLAQIRDAAVGSGAGDTRSGAPAPTVLQTAAGERNDYTQFSRSGNSDRWALDSQPEAPRSPYELRAGFVVPAILISGINSDLPGQIMAQVAQDVYDTPTGQHLLIPQGSRLVGTYSSDVAYGQARVLVAWQRIIFPDGKAMDIGAMPGADSAGYAGFKDQVQTHYVRVFSSAFLMSAVVAGVAYSQRRDRTDAFGAPSASSALSEALGQQLGQVTAQMIAKNLNIAPTLEIRPGYRFNVIVTKDMTFSKPYRAFDY